MTLTAYCVPIRDIPIDEIDTAAVLRVLKPLWTRVAATAERLRGRIETVIDSARALGQVDENRANPARWRGHLDHLLPKRGTLERGHFAAMPYRDIPAFMAKLKTARGMSVIAIRFVILTAARSNEACGMQWDEVDLDAKVWTAPAERMKAHREHHVPLSAAAIEILHEQQARRRPKQPHVFAGAKQNEPIGGMALTTRMRSLGARQFTVHGFRSSFRDWAADHGVEFEVAEQCLALKVGNAVTQAYLRTTMLERRRKVMQAWADYLDGKDAAATVVPFQSARR
jgi:integrase